MLLATHPVAPGPTTTPPLTCEGNLGDGFQDRFTVRELLLDDSMLFVYFLATVFLKSFMNLTC